MVINYIAENSFVLDKLLLSPILVSSHSYHLVLFPFIHREQHI